MAKLTLTDLSTHRLSSIDRQNANNALIETALENTLSRDGTSPNQLEANIDMNEHTLLNVLYPAAPHHAANRQYVDDLVNAITGGDGGQLSTLIAANTAALDTKATITYVDSVVATETSARATAITNLTATVTSNTTSLSSKAAISYVDSVVATETSARATAITNLDTAYQAADAALLADIVTKASVSYVDTAVSDETSARATSEAAIIAAYEAMDTTLQTDIDTRATITYVDSSVATETSARATSESAITAAYQAADLVVRDIGRNLIRNPSGSDGTNNWTHKANWTTGDSSLGRYITTTTVGSQYISSELFPVVAGRNYSFGVNAGGQTFTSGFFEVQWKDGSGLAVDTDTIAVLNSDLNYSRYTNTIVAPFGATQALVRIGATVSSGFFLFYSAKAEDRAAPTMFSNDVWYVDSQAEINTNTTAIASNTSSIATTETTLRAEFEAADAAQTVIIDTKAAITYVDSAIATESSARASADSTLTADVATNTANVSTNTTAIASETSARISADSTLTATAGTNTSNISINATAVADIEGNIAGRYAIDVNGSFISIEDGTTEPGTITLDASQVRIDAEDIILSGTIKSANIGDAQIVEAKIGDLAVDTIKIAGGAVSDSAFTAVSGNTASIVHAARSGSVLLYAVMYPTSTSSRTVFLKRGATTLRTFTISSSVPIVIMYVDNPGTATYTYQATSSGAFNATELLLLEVVK